MKSHYWGSFSIFALQILYALWCYLYFLVIPSYFSFLLELHKLNALYSCIQPNVQSLDSLFMQFCLWIWVARDLPLRDHLKKDLSKCIMIRHAYQLDFDSNNYQYILGDKHKLLTFAHICCTCHTHTHVTNLSLEFPIFDLLRMWPCLFNACSFQIMLVNSKLSTISSPISLHKQYIKPIWLCAYVTLYTLKHFKAITILT